MPKFCSQGLRSLCVIPEALNRQFSSKSGDRQGLSWSLMYVSSGQSSRHRCLHYKKLMSKLQSRRGCALLMCRRRGRARRCGWFPGARRALRMKSWPPSVAASCQTAASTQRPTCRCAQPPPLTWQKLLPDCNPAANLRIACSPSKGPSLKRNWRVSFVAGLRGLWSWTLCRCCLRCGGAPRVCRA